MRSWPWPLLLLSGSFFFFHVFCFWPTLGILPKVKFPPSYFGITRRNIKKSFFFNSKSSFYKSWFSAVFSTFHGKWGGIHLWKQIIEKFDNLAWLMSSRTQKIIRFLRKLRLHSQSAVNYAKCLESLTSKIIHIEEEKKFGHTKVITRLNASGKSLDFDWGLENSN